MDLTKLIQKSKSCHNLSLLNPKDLEPLASSRFLRSHIPISAKQEENAKAVSPTELSEESSSSDSSPVFPMLGIFKIHKIDSPLGFLSDDSPVEDETENKSSSESLEAPTSSALQKASIKSQKVYSCQKTTLK